MYVLMLHAKNIRGYEEGQNTVGIEKERKDLWSSGTNKKKKDTFIFQRAGCPSGEREQVTYYFPQNPTTNYYLNLNGTWKTVQPRAEKGLHEPEPEPESESEPGLLQQVCLMYHQVTSLPTHVGMYVCKYST